MIIKTYGCVAEILRMMYTLMLIKISSIVGLFNAIILNASHYEIVGTKLLLFVRKAGTN